MKLNNLKVLGILQVIFILFTDKFLTQLFFLFNVFILAWIDIRSSRRRR
jgi:hypothetical protein